MSNKQDENSIGGRLKRYAKVSGTMGKLAATLAGEKYLGIDIDKDEHAKKLKDALGNLKGPLMKIAQLLATIPEALPQEYVMELQQLQSNAPSMGWPFVKRRMKSELGEDWVSKFKSFDKTATAAASLGQVHKAQTLQGETIACKLQYPDMASAIEADLKQLKVILSIFERYDNTVSTVHVQKEIADRLREELDYEREAKFCRLYGEMLKDEPNVHVPKVVDNLSTKRLITTSWVEGENIMNFKQAPLEVRNQIALNMFKAWYIPLYNYGIIHGDPHMGNYTVNKDLSINLFDFGCVRVFPPSFVHGVLELYHALRENDQERAVEAYKIWGFGTMTKELVEILNIWAGFLYAPVLDDKVRKIGEMTTGVYGRETAEEVHKKLRAIGGITVPREFVFMDRAALGLGSVFLHLQAEVNWYEVFNSLIKDFDQKEMQQKQEKILTKYDLLA